MAEREHERDHVKIGDKGAHKEKSLSPISHSPSPCSNRLMRLQDEREAEKATGREHERNHGREVIREYTGKVHSLLFHALLPLVRIS